MSSKSRLIEFDILKGLGILFVILGHSVPDFPVNLRADFLSGTIEKLMYSFHMPLFFICAGCMVQMFDSKQVVSGGGFLKKKFLRLIVPYMCFSIAVLILKILFSSFTRSGVDFCDSIYGIMFEGKYYWFLYVMFLVLTTVELLRRLKVKYLYVWLIAFSFYLLGLYLNTSFLCLNRFGYYFLFTMVGTLAYKHKSSIDKFVSHWYSNLLLFLVFAFLFSVRVPDVLIIKELFRFILAIVGTTLTYSLSLWIKENCNKMTAILFYFGVMSLAYYLVHMINQLPIYYLVAKMNLPIPVLSVVAIFAITTLLTYIMVKIMNSIPICRFMMGMPMSNK